MHRSMICSDETSIAAQVQDRVLEKGNICYVGEFFTDFTIWGGLLSGVTTKTP